MQLDVEEYREGGRNGEVLQFPTRVKWGKITLKKGMGSAARCGTGITDLRKERQAARRRDRVDGQ